MGQTVDRIRLLEDIGADAWPAATTIWLRGWRLGLDQGVTRRANSVLPNAREPVRDPDALIEAVERHYRAHGLQPCFKLTAAAEPADLDHRLERRGYRAEGHSLVLVVDASKIAGEPASPLAITLDDRPSEDWLDACWPVAQYAGERAALKQIAVRVPAPRAFGLARLGSTACGAALAVTGRGWAGLTAVHTLPDHRRRGVARGLLGALAAWAAQQGADRLYLQVEADNTAARRLYAGLGFTEAYPYHYRRSA